MATHYVRTSKLQLLLSECMHLPLPECVQHGEADGIEHRVRRTEVIEEHDEEPVVGQLVELVVTILVVMEQNVSHRHQHLYERRGRS